MNLDAWWASGERRRLAGHEIFVRTEGDAGAWTTWLHGFPTSSWDWAPLLEAVEGGGRHLCLDFLGFGASDKPARHPYAIVEQADIIAAAWRELGIGSTRLVAHDYGVSVAQELLARAGDGGGLGVELTEVAFLNGGLFPALHRPLRVQRLLAGPAGPLLSRLATERTFTQGLGEVMAKPPPAEELHQHWRAFSRAGGHRRAHRLLRYMAERRANEARWVGALEATAVPLRFVWGPLDPVSGAHVVPELRRRLPGSPVTVLDGVGHYPQLEATAEVAAALG